MNFEFATNCKMVLIKVALFEVGNVVLAVAVKLKKLNHPNTHLVPVYVQGVVVKSRIADQTHPLIPTHWDVVAMVFVEVFAKVACKKQHHLS